MKYKKMTSGSKGVYLIKTSRPLIEPISENMPLKIPPDLPPKNFVSVFYPLSGMFPACKNRPLSTYFVLFRPCKKFLGTRLGTTKAT